MTNRFESPGSNSPLDYFEIEKTFALLAQQVASGGIRQRGRQGLIALEKARLALVTARLEELGARPNTTTFHEHKEVEGGLLRVALFPTTRDGRPRSTVQHVVVTRIPGPEDAENGVQCKTTDHAINFGKKTAQSKTGYWPAANAEQPPADMPAAVINRADSLCLTKVPYDYDLNPPKAPQDYRQELGLVLAELNLLAPEFVDEGGTRV